jgi:phosphohistidine phosphatase
MALILDLVRHGHAEPSNPLGDALRRLSAEGERAMVELAERLAGDGPAPTRLLSSPLLRARQSASIIGRAVEPRVDVEELEELVPDAEAGSTIAALVRCGVASGHAVLVGHMPHLGDLHALLTGESASFATATLRRIEFPGAAVAHYGRAVRAWR